MRLLGKADALRQQENATILKSDQDRINEVTARTRTKLERAQWERVWSEGQQLSMDDAVALAVGTPAAAEESYPGK